MTDPATPPFLVVPVQSATIGKSRLRRELSELGWVSGGAATGLVRALAVDTLEAAARAVGSSRCTVVTADGPVSRWAARAGLRVVADPGSGLNGALAAGLATTPPGQAVAVLLGDLPALTAPVLRRALAAAREHDRALVPDAEGTGTVLLTAAPGQLLTPAFGPESARAHADAGHRRLDLDLPGLRTDVDTLAALAAAAVGGLGARTTAAAGPILQALELATAGATSVGAMQASVHSHDVETGTGTALTDDGRLVSYDSDVFAASSLRLARPGQRVSIELDGERVTRLWIVGVGPGQPIR